MKLRIKKADAALLLTALAKLQIHDTALNARKARITSTLTDRWPAIVLPEEAPTKRGAKR